MKRCIVGLGLLALLSGCVSNQPGSYMSQANNPMANQQVRNGAYQTQCIPNMMGPRGEPVAVQVPPTALDPTSGQAVARNILSQSGIPSDIVRAVSEQVDGPQGNSIQLTGGQGPDLGMPPGGATGLPPGGPTGMNPPRTLPGLMVGGGPMMGGGMPPMGGGMPPMQAAPSLRTSVRFTGPAGMKVSWYAPKADGTPALTTNTLDLPARYNFVQASIFRLKLSNIPNRPGVELYPTLEVVPANNRTATFLAHASVPLTFTDEDFDQVQAGNYLVKVIYLPDPQYQDLANSGPDEVVSTRLEPGIDPITEAQKRGSILLVVRLGNIDLEAPNTPAMGTPGMFGPKPMMPPGGPQSMLNNGIPMPGPQVPYMNPNGGPGPGGTLMPPGAGGMMMPPPGMGGMMPPGMGGMMPPGAGGMMMPPPGMGGPTMGMPIPPGGPVMGQPVMGQPMSRPRQ